MMRPWTSPMRQRSIAPSTAFARLDRGTRLSAARSPVELAAVGHDGVHLQPLPILLRREALPSITEFLAGGGRAIRKWLATVPHRVVDMPELAGCFDSLNLPEFTIARNNSKCDGRTDSIVFSDLYHYC